MSTPPEDIPIIRAISALVILHALISRPSSNGHAAAYLDEALNVADQLLTKAGLDI